MLHFRDNGVCMAPRSRVFGWTGRVDPLQLSETFHNPVGYWKLCEKLREVGGNVWRGASNAWSTTLELVDCFDN